MERQQIKGLLKAFLGLILALLFLRFVIALVEVVREGHAQETQTQPKGFVDELKKDGNTLTFLSIDSQSTKEFLDIYKLAIAKVKEKYSSEPLNCKISILAELKNSEKKYRTIWVKVDVKGKKSVPETSMSFPRSEEDIGKLPQDQGDFFRSQRKDQIDQIIRQILSYSSCSKEDGE